MLDKIFDPASIEDRWYAHWESTGSFRPARPQARPFTIVLPPPNITGVLHIGHALDQTLQDILIRWQRLRGHDARWVVGTDHAGIATQMVVERQLATSGLDRRTIGRAAFLDHVWAWKEQSGNTITRQMRRLGASCDWGHERFTMDDGMSKAVREAFVRLYEQGLIYRDKRLVNWDPKFETAISDLEVESKELAGHFWHLRYPLADGSGMMVVATTRPETMLGDTAVAVHPDDDRYKALIGKLVAHPLTGRQIPVIADEWADPALGSGVVKITPAHDFNDWAVYERHRDIGWINVLDSRARIATDPRIPVRYQGLDRFEARSLIVSDLEELGLLEGLEDKLVQVPHGDRSGAIIEPWLTDQWWVDTAKLAEAARAAVTDGRTQFIPKTWEKTYFNWLDNIEPWCISRQLWWGHRIPAWYAEDGSVVVARTKDEAQKLAPGLILTQDDDVLDTWFSSGLWPFATLGWPEQTADLARHYPGDVLVTAFDIIFFWVARMMMQGLAMMEDVPFHTIYIHGLVRDKDGQKMSKSKGNAVDPLDLVDRFGADALRMAMAASESQGRDVKFDEKRVEGYRNFATKLWNAVRFAQAQGVEAAAGGARPAPTHSVNQWVLSQSDAMVREATAALEAFRYDQYAQTLYHFVWNRFCDWYLELAKPLLAADSALRSETQAVTAYVLDRILLCLHPVMPFITEELWHALGQRPHDLIVGQWPQVDASEEQGAGDEINWLIDLVTAVRSARSALNVPPGARLALHATDGDAAILARLQSHLPALGRLARIDRLAGGPAPQGGSAQLVVDGKGYALPLAGVIDLAAERARLEKTAAAAAKEATALRGRLANAGFVERAKPEAVEKARQDLAAREEEEARLRAALAALV